MEKGSKRQDSDFSLSFIFHRAEQSHITLLAAYTRCYLLVTSLILLVNNMKNMNALRICKDCTLPHIGSPSKEDKLFYLDNTLRQSSLVVEVCGLSWKYRWVK